METKDLIVIGGGINGAGIAADAAGRGRMVAGACACVDVVGGCLAAGLVDSAQPLWLAPVRGR